MKLFPSLLSRKAFSGFPYISPFKYCAFNKHFAITHARKPLQVFPFLPKSVGCLKKARQYFWSAQSYLSPYFQALFLHICLDLQKRTFFGPDQRATPPPLHPPFVTASALLLPHRKRKEGDKEEEEAISGNIIPLFSRMLLIATFRHPNHAFPFHMQISHPSSSPSPSLPCTF